MVRKLEYHQQSSEESRRYVTNAAVASGDEKKRKALDGFTQHKLFDRRKKEASRRARSESPHLPAQRPPRADGAKRSVGRIAKEGSRERVPRKYAGRASVTGSVPVAGNFETRQVIAASRSRSSVALSESKQATRNTSRGRNVDRVPREHSRRGRSAGQAYLGRTQSADRSDILYQVMRKEKAVQDSISVAGSRATSKATRLPKNVHRMPVSRNASKESSKTSNSKHSDDTEVGSRRTHPNAVREKVGGSSRLSRTQSEVFRTKKLHVQTDSFEGMFGECVSPTLAALLDPFPRQTVKKKPKTIVLSQNEQEPSDTSSILAMLGEPQTGTNEEHPESIPSIERLEQGDTSNSHTDVVQHQSNTKGSLDLAVATEPHQATKRKLDRLLFFRNRAAVSARRDKSVPRSPRNWPQNSERHLESSLHSAPTIAVEREHVSVDEASTPMNSKTAANSSVDTSSIAESVKTARSRSWMKLAKSLRRRNAGKADSPLHQPPEDHEFAQDSSVVVAIVETKREKETSEPEKKIQRPGLRSPRNKKKLSEDKKSDLGKQTPKNRKSKPDEDEMRPSRFSLSPRKSPRKHVFGRAGTKQSEDLVVVQAPLPLIMIDNETEDGVEAVLCVPSKTIASTNYDDMGPSVASGKSVQPSTQYRGLTEGHVEDRCDVEDFHPKEQGISMRESAVGEDRDCRKKKGARGEKLLQELYGGESQSFDERPLTRFISSPTLSNNEHTDDFCDSEMSRSHRKANRSFSFSEDEDECSEVYSETREDEYSDASSFSEDSSSEESTEDERSGRSDRYESDQSSYSDVLRNQSDEDSTVSTLSIIKNLKLSRKGNTVTSDISENSAASEWSDMESFDSDEEKSVSEKDVVQRLLLSKYRKKHR